MSIPSPKVLSMAALALMFLLLTGCAAAPPPFEHQVEVRNESGSPVAGANVTAEIALRYAVHGVTDSEGAVVDTTEFFGPAGGAEAPAEEAPAEAEAPAEEAGDDDAEEKAAKKAEKKAKKKADKEAENAAE